MKVNNVGVSLYDTHGLDSEKKSSEMNNEKQMHKGCMNYDALKSYMKSNT